MGGKLRNCTFVDFKNDALAYQAQRQLKGYAYTSPDGNIITNIVKAIIAVPRFYCQVLHLMNQMNIPAPFRMALHAPPVPASAPPRPLSAETKATPADMSSCESELESSEEEAGNNASSLKAKSGRKRPRKEAILGPAEDKDVAHESVGVKPAALVPKEIPMIKKINPVLQIKIAQKIPKTQPIDDHVMNDSEKTEKDTSDVEPFVTPDELEKGRLPPEEISSLPKFKFKNYTSGNPAPVLYVKNLAKDVVVEAFYYIFGSLFGNVDKAKSSINVKLMQEGRMSGQAFVSFPSVELAHHALAGTLTATLLLSSSNLLNGYVFKDKPMIIQFGRNPLAAKAN